MRARPPAGGHRRDYATKGGQVVGEVVSTMGAIKASSSKIVDIISVDGIAFQTNILALNAAVAARAGEQGAALPWWRRKCARWRSAPAAAAKEIKELIDDSVETVDSGAALVDQAGATMQGIVQRCSRWRTSCTRSAPPAASKAPG
jgi:methyl-accepting chemotaxis protein